MSRNVEGCLMDVKDGLKLKEKFREASSTNGIVLPYLLYFDDFEVGNPLGSHKGSYKVGAVYCLCVVYQHSIIAKFQTFILYSCFTVQTETLLAML